MISQDAQAMGYISSMPESIGTSRTILHERTVPQGYFRDVIIAIVMMLVPVVLTVSLNGINAQEEFSLQGIRREVMTMAKENAVMKLEVSRLEAPVRVQQIAESKLGMSLPLRAVYGGQDPVTPDHNKGR